MTMTLTQNQRIAVLDAIRARLVGDPEWEAEALAGLGMTPAQVCEAMEELWPCDWDEFAEQRAEVLRATS